MGVVSPQPCIAVPRHLMGQRRRWAEYTKAYPILRDLFSRSPADLCEPRAGRARGDRRRSMPSRSFSGADFFTAYQERTRPRWATRQRHASNVQRSGCVREAEARSKSAGPNARMRREQRSRPAEGRGTQSASGWLDGRQASQPRPASLRWDGGRVLILGRGRGGRIAYCGAAISVDSAAGALVQLSHHAACLNVQHQGTLGFATHDLPGTAETGSGCNTEGEGFHGGSFSQNLGNTLMVVAILRCSKSCCRSVAASLRLRASEGILDHFSTCPPHGGHSGIRSAPWAGRRLRTQDPARTASPGAAARAESRFALNDGLRSRRRSKRGSREECTASPDTRAGFHHPLSSHQGIRARRPCARGLAGHRMHGALDVEIVGAALLSGRMGQLH